MLGPLGPKFFFLTCKIFKKKAWAPWFLARAPHLNHTYPSRPAQEPMKTLKKYICKKEKKEEEEIPAVSIQ